MTQTVKAARKLISGSGWSNPLGHDAYLESSSHLHVYADDTGYRYAGGAQASMLLGVHRFAVDMRASPTLTVGTPTYANASSISIGASGVDGAYVRVSTSGAGVFRATSATWTADAEL